MENKYFRLTEGQLVIQMPGRGLRRSSIEREVAEKIGNKIVRKKVVETVIEQKVCHMVVRIKVEIVKIWSETLTKHEQTQLKFKLPYTPATPAIRFHEQCREHTFHLAESAGIDPKRINWKFLFTS